jgi:hypothetical protein
MKNKITTLVFFVSTVITLNAQLIKEFKAGLAFPQGSFKYDDNNWLDAGSGAAAMGYTAGLKFLSPFKLEGLSLSFEANAIYNDLQRNFKMDIEDSYNNSSVDNYSLPKYLNIPLLFGVQYEKSLSDDIAFFGTGGLGANIFKITNFMREQSQYNFKETIQFNTAVTSTFKLGAGVILQQKYVIGIEYFRLGAHRIEYVERRTYNGNTITKRERFAKTLDVGSLNVSIAVRF